MANGSARGLLLLAIILSAAMAEDRRRPKPLSWLATKGVEVVDIDDVLEGVDINAIAQRIDLDALLAEVDVQALIERIDLDAVLADVDLNAVLERVDLNAVLDRVDANRLLDQVDANRLLDLVDANRLLDRVDVDRFMDRVDVPAIVDRAGIADIVKESTGAITGSVLDVVRRQLVAVDQIVERPIYRLTGRDPHQRPAGPPELVEKHPAIKDGRGQVTGSYAGPVSRVLAFAIDASLVFWVFTLATAGITWIAKSVGVQIPQQPSSGYVGLGIFIIWGYLYWWVGLALTGRTIGKGIIGLRVLQDDGDPITGGEAAMRTLILPLSFLLLAFGVIVVLISPRRRTLHDAVARTCEVYDWGDRAAELPAPLTAWIARRAQAAEEPQ